MERGISDEKGEFGKQKQEKLCKIWGINDDETNCILTKLKRHKIIKNFQKVLTKGGHLVIIIFVAGEAAKQNKRMWRNWQTR